MDGVRKRTRTLAGKGKMELNEVLILQNEQRWLSRVEAAGLDPKELDQLALSVPKNASRQTRELARTIRADLETSQFGVTRSRANVRPASRDAEHSSL